MGGILRVGMQNTAVLGIDVDLKGAAVSVYAFHDDGILGIALHVGGILDGASVR